MVSLFVCLCWSVKTLSMRSSKQKNYPHIHVTKGVWLCCLKQVQDVFWNAVYCIVRSIACTKWGKRGAVLLWGENGLHACVAIEYTHNKHINKVVCWQCRGGAWHFCFDQYTTRELLRFSPTFDSCVQQNRTVHTCLYTQCACYRYMWGKRSLRGPQAMLV